MNLGTSLGGPAAEGKLKELESTAISGNDITASCFYIVGELAQHALAFGPLCTLMASLTLYCFRWVYGEVVSALPLNGGMYNVLLNSSSKLTASVCACLVILSYTATCVVSAVSAVEYFQATGTEVPVVLLSCAVILFFAWLSVIGISESAVCASLLFVFHLGVLSYLLVAGAYCVVFEMGTFVFWDNVDLTLAAQYTFAGSASGVLKCLYFGFAHAMLGVSGFETSSNFVEEQADGVYLKTLKNMWVAVTLVNFSVTLLSLFVCPLEDLIWRQEYSVALVAEVIGGKTLRYVVCVDALLVLSGSVLTSFVGTVGLVQRMAQDRCLPDIFRERHPKYGTSHLAIGCFAFICCSMCILLRGEVSQLSAVYAVAFMLVMMLYSGCGLWMKLKRPLLPRPLDSHPLMFIAGFSLVATAFSAQIVLKPRMLAVFGVYFVGTCAAVMTVFWRSPLSEVILFLGGFGSKKLCRYLAEGIEFRRQMGVVFYTKSGDFGQLVQAVQYILANEESRWIRICHFYKSKRFIPTNLQEYCALLDCAFSQDARIDCVLVKGGFTPENIQFMGNELNIPISSMFITCPTRNFSYRVERLGGVRIILNTEPRSPPIRKWNQLIDFSYQKLQRTSPHSPSLRPRRISRPSFPAADNELAYSSQLPFRFEPAFVRANSEENMDDTCSYILRNVSQYTVY